MDVIFSKGKKIIKETKEADFETGDMTGEGGDMGVVLSEGKGKILRKHIFLSSQNNLGSLVH